MGGIRAEWAENRGFWEMGEMRKRGFFGGEERERGERGTGRRGEERGAGKGKGRNPTDFTVSHMTR
jgi:hypothetical protein